MRMQKEEKIVIVLPMMAFCSLALAEWTIDGSDQNVTEEKSSSSTFQGYVTDIKPTKIGGNLIIHLDATDNSIFVPRDSGAKDIQGRIHVGDLVKVRGELSEFNGKMEIKVSRKTDVQIIKS
jgi:hypothetical protein